MESEKRTKAKRERGKEIRELTLLCLLFSFGFFPTPSLYCLPSSFALFPSFLLLLCITSRRGKREGEENRKGKRGEWCLPLLWHLLFSFAFSHLWDAKAKWAVLENKKKGIANGYPLKWAQKRARVSLINRTPLPVTVLSDYREKGKTYPNQPRLFLTC